jgi:N-acetylglucosaminyldiphosphoundecaprenol N-acetyl-beta-D-mannosaminyltransferase
LSSIGVPTSFSHPWGSQEKLGCRLRENLVLPAGDPLHGCAALGFITCDQPAIPDWADWLYLGWLCRLVAQPRIFVPRLIRGFELPWLIWKYGENLPPMRTVARGRVSDVTNSNKRTIQ